MMFSIMQFSLSVDVSSMIWIYKDIISILFIIPYFILYFSIFNILSFFIPLYCGFGEFNLILFRFVIRSSERIGKNFILHQHIPPLKHNKFHYLTNVGFLLYYASKTIAIIYINFNPLYDYLFKNK